MRTWIGLIVLAGCATQPDSISRTEIISSGTNVDHLLAGDGTLTWTEGGAIRQLDLASGAVTTVATHVDGGPWGLVRSGGGLIAGVDYACPGAPTECISGPSLQRSDGAVVTTLGELTDAHSLAAIGDRIYALSSGLVEGATGCGDIGQLVEIGPDGHRRIGTLESDPRRAVRALGGIAYSVSDAHASIDPCTAGDIAVATRSIRVFDGHDIHTFALGTAWVGVLGGTDDALFAAHWLDGGRAEVLALDHAGAISPLGEIDASLTPIAAAAVGDKVAVALVAIESSSDPARCGENPTPCLVVGDTRVRMLGDAADVTVAGPTEVLLDLQSVDGRLFAGTTTSLVEVK
jgi:hypothetical protein